MTNRMVKLEDVIRGLDIALRNSMNEEEFSLLTVLKLYVEWLPAYDIEMENRDGTL